MRHSQAEEDEDFCPDTCTMVVGIDTERLKCSEDYENGGPTMVKGKWKVDEELVAEALRRVMLLDNVVDVLL